MSLNVQLFGDPRIEVNRVPAALRHRRAVLLLCLLLVRQGRPILRTALSETIWPEFDSFSGSVNLRRAVADLRVLLGPEASRLETVDRRELSFRVDSALTCDLLNFDTAANRFERTAALKDAREAVSLYIGMLLPGWTDDCLEPERRYRQEAAAEMLEALARDALHNRADPIEALHLCRRAEQAAPYRETIWRLRVEAYLKQNDRSAAEAAFQEFAERKDRESTLPSQYETPPLKGSTRSPHSRQMTTLPCESGLMIGRSSELDFLQEKIRQGRVSNVSRLTTITGPGGVGKTRFALAAARAFVAEPGDSAVVFADFSHLPRGASAAIIQDVVILALEMQVRGEPSSESNMAVVPAVSAITTERVLYNLLKDFVAKQANTQKGETILLLDNAEHLLPTFAFVTADVLRMAPSLTVLVTSRIPLNLPGEELLPLLPLSLPETDRVEAVEAADAPRLFIERARAVQPGFRLDTASASRISRICRLLDGLPLAVELAAARLRSLSLTDLETRLTQKNEMSLSLLSGVSATRPLRQQTVGDAVAWSWSLLSREQQTLLARLSVFRGGWDLTMMCEALGFAPLTTEPTIIALFSDLVDHSLIQAVTNPRGETEKRRYRLLESIRAFAAARLVEGVNSVQEEAQTKERFSQWASRFATECRDELWKEDAAAWTDRFAEEAENLRAGLEVADAPTAENIVRGIEPIWWRQGRYLEGIHWQETARKKAEQAGDTYRATVLRLTEELFRHNLGQPHQARTVFAVAIALTLERGEKEPVVYLLHSLACLERDDGELNRAADTMRRGTFLAAEVNAGKESSGLQAYQWRGMAQIDIACQRFKEAESLCHRALAVYRKEQNVVQEMMTLRWLGQALLGQGDAEGAYVVYSESRSFARKTISPQIEQEAEQGLGESSLELGDVSAAEGHFRAAFVLSHANGSQEGIALAACGESMVARTVGFPNILPTAHLLFLPGAAFLPYPALVRVLQEAVLAAEACNLTRTAQRLKTEADATRAAPSMEKSPDGIVWSAHLTITRARAAYPPESLSAILDFSKQSR